MPRKKHKYHFIYKTTNLINSKYYIGMHSTSDLKDGYLGSGKRLRRSLIKYGKENFKFEILENLNDRDSLAKRESEIVNEELINDPLCMNLVKGGNGGCTEESQFKRSQAGGLATGKKLKDENYKKIHIKKLSEGQKLSYKNGRIIKTPNWIGRNHKEKTIDKISLSMKGKYDGDKHPQYGTCWINKEGVNKKIKKEETNLYLNLGWNKGRKMK